MTNDNQKLYELVCSITDDKLDEHYRKRGVLIKVLIFLLVVLIGICLIVNGMERGDKSHSNTNDGVPVSENNEDTFIIEDSTDINYLLELPSTSDNSPTRYCFSPYKVEYSGGYITYTNESMQISIKDGVCFIIRDDFIECYSDFKLVKLR